MKFGGAKDCVSPCGFEVTKRSPRGTYQLWKERLDLTFVSGAKAQLQEQRPKEPRDAAVTLDDGQTFRFWLDSPRRSSRYEGATWTLEPTPSKDRIHELGRDVSDFLAVPTSSEPVFIGQAAQIPANAPESIRNVLVGACISSVLGRMRRQCSG
jgi:hypothetical protein